MRTCCQCGATFTPTGNGYRCSTCRKEYDRAWRARRKTEGKATGGGKMPREYHHAYETEYFKNPETRERRNARAREYSKAPGTRDHHKARWLVRRAIKAGRLTRKPCEICGASPTEAHHDDYSRPLDVRWLCKRHHVEHHNAKAEGKS